MTRSKHHLVQLRGWVRNPSTEDTNMVESLMPGQKSVAVSYPKEGINLLCGQRFARESMARALKEANSRNDVLLPIEVKVSAWRPSNSHHWCDNWANKTLVDLHRLNPDCEAVLIQHWKKYLSEDGFSERDIRDFGWSRRQFIERAPHYIDRLRHEEQFAKVDVFIWHTIENGIRVARATLYNTRAILSVRAITVAPVHVDMPSLQLEAA